MQRNGKLRYGYNFTETYILGVIYSYERDIQLLGLNKNIFVEIDVAEYINNDERSNNVWDIEIDVNFLDFSGLNLSKEI